MENRMNEIPDEYPFNLLLAAKGDTTLALPLKLTADILAGVQYSLSTLSEQEQTILHRRYIACGSISDIASRFSVTEECIRQIERKALFKLREPSRWNYILFGVAGYCKDRATTEYNKGYSKGYRDGYRHGRTDAENNVAFSYGPEDLLSQPIQYLNLSTRAQQCMFGFGCKTVGDIVRLTEEQIMRTRNLGKKSADEIARKLNAAGAKGSPWDQFLL